jgi:ABC-type uncharacterized transport system substrate-binding protein
MEHTRRNEPDLCCRWLFAAGHWLLALLLFAAGATVSNAAPSFQVELLLSDTSTLYSQVAGAYQAELSLACATRCDMAPSVRVSHVGDWKAAAPRDLLVTIGTAAALAAARQGATRVVYGLIPESRWDELQQLRPQAPGDASAVFLEQPLSRQFRLLKVAMPAKQRRVGIVLGPESAALEPLLLAAASEHGLSLRVQRAPDWDEVGPAVEKLVDKIDVLLAVPDPLVFNRDTLYGILLTSYRAGVPVMGYSRALVDAGAMLGLYTSGANVARQLAHVSGDFIANGGALPPAGRSRYFEIGVNRNVARSLGVELPETAALRLLVDRPR